MLGRRGEQARVAQRVRGLLATHLPANRVGDERWGKRVDLGGWSEEHGGGSERVRSAAGDQPLLPPGGPHLPPTGVAGWLDRRGIRIDPSRRAVAAIGVAVVVVAVAAGWWAFAGRPRQIAVATASPTAQVSAASASLSPAGAVPASTGSTGAQVVVIDVVGRVRRPGVYRLPAGSRVEDALRAAGGPSRGVDLSTLNLARRLVDGEQVAVGVAVALTTAAGPSGSSATGASGPLELNTATLEQLEALPGVGPVLAQHILDWRNAHGRFDSVDQLREVSGIGPSRFDDLRPLVTV